jgi:MinD superfamily P-loop ATPase
MIIAIASGKGGTGKTTVATAFALASEEPITLLDCDVEEPNAHFFIHADLDSQTSEDAYVAVPSVIKDKCTGCGACARLCQFNAIVVIGPPAMIFPELCHSCGGCALVCPNAAIVEKPFQIGKIKQARTGFINLVQGELKIGAAMSPPLIRAVKSKSLPGELIIIDSPPGTSCPMVSAVKDSDYVILVAEPTPFGLHDLKLAVNTVRKMKIPFGIIINKFDIGNQELENYTLMEKITVLARIPYQRNISVAYSQGKNILPEADGKYLEIFSTLLEKIKKEPGRV